jgi:DNA-binding NarL/FixJ family response regulator
MIDAIDAVNGNSSSKVQYSPTVKPGTAGAQESSLTNKLTAPQESSHKPTAAQDSAFLSLDARAKLLEQQGLSVQEIADQLGIPPATVQADLGITIVSTQTKTATA